MAIQAAGGYLNTGVMILQGLLLVPLYLRFIGPRWYGLWVASGGILALLNVMNLGLGALLMQRVAKAHGEKDPVKAGAYLVNGLVVYLGLSATFVLAGQILAFWLPVLLQVSPAEALLLRRCFQVAVLAAGLGLFNECLRGGAQALLRPLLPSVSWTLARVTSVWAVVFLLYRGVGLWALPLGMVVTESLVFVSGAYQIGSLLRELGARPSLERSILKEYLTIGSALFMARLGSVLSSEGDPLLIAVLVRPEAAAAYTVARRAGDIVFRLLSVINASSQSSFFHLVGEGDRGRTGAIAARLLTLVFALGLAGFGCYVALNAVFVSAWVGTGFVQHHAVTLFVGIALFCSALRNMLLLLLNGLGAFRETAKVTLLEGVAKFALAAGLLKLLGVAGAPLSLLLTSAVSLGIFWRMLRRKMDLALTAQAAGAAVVVGVAAFAVAEGMAVLLDPARIPVGILASLAACAAAVAGLLALKRKHLRSLIGAGI